MGGKQSEKEVNKDFKKDFYKILAKVKKSENFAFTRFSDGEMDVLWNIPLQLQPNLVRVGNSRARKNYDPVDHKDFTPENPRHQQFRKELYEAFRFRKKNYFKGISCQCCVGKDNFERMLKEHGPGDDEHLTWANLLVNSNYPLFIEEMVPLFKDKKCVMVCHKQANLNKLPFDLIKDFRVGYNAFINDIPVIDEIAEWVKKENIENHVFLFSASSFSALAIHKLYDKYPNNTYINIGTTLNKFMDMPVDRGYLKYYWSNTVGGTLTKTCIWK